MSAPLLPLPLGIGFGGTCVIITSEIELSISTTLISGFLYFFLGIIYIACFNRETKYRYLKQVTNIIYYSILAKNLVLSKKISLRTEIDNQGIKLQDIGIFKMISIYVPKTVMIDFVPVVPYKSDMNGPAAGKGQFSQTDSA